MRVKWKFAAQKQNVTCTRMGWTILLLVYKTTKRWNKCREISILLYILEDTVLSPYNTISHIHIKITPNLHIT